MAETWLIRGEGGGIVKMSLPLHEVVAHQLLKGFARRVNEDGTDWTPEQAPERPPVTARKLDWVAWAVHKGEKPDDAEAWTKQDLIEKYGA